MKSSQAHLRRRGTILVVTMILCFTLASVVLVLCHSMAVEAVASANVTAGVQADAVERGAEQYFLGLLATNASHYAIMDPTTYDDTYWDGVQVGKGYFWLLRPDYGDSSLPVFGPIDESGKLDLNFATFEQLQVLPGMTDDLAAALADWKSTDVNTGGAKSDYYQSLATPYLCKEAPYESVEETLMVRGMTKDILYGLPGAAPLGQASTSDTFGTGPGLTDTGALPHGLADLLTIYSYSTNQTAPRGKINANTAPAAVLNCILINGAVVDSSIISTAVAARQSASAYGLQDVAWATGAGLNVGGGGRNGVPNFVSASQSFSADILAVSGNGRGFKRVKIIVGFGAGAEAGGNQNTSTAPQIVYRRDFTSQGWPLDPDILDQIRAGTYQSPGGSVYADATSGGTTH